MASRCGRGRAQADRVVALDACGVGERHGDPGRSPTGYAALRVTPRRPCRSESACACTVTAALVGRRRPRRRRDRRLRPRLLRAPEALHRRPRRRGAARRDRGRRHCPTGAFRSYEHATSGRARVIATADGRRYVRFEDFETSNGPALKVYLSAAPASGPGDSFDDRFVDLGDLKGNIGSQNYRDPRRRAASTATAASSCGASASASPSRRRAVTPAEAAPRAVILSAKRGRAARNTAGPSGTAPQPPTRRPSWQPPPAGPAPRPCPA